MRGAAVADASNMSRHMPSVDALESTDDRRLDAELRLARVREQLAIVRTITDRIERRRADMVVLSTHGRRGIQHAFVGSVAEKIVRLSPVPVLTLGPK